MKYYRVMLLKNFVVPVDDADGIDAVRAEALRELRILLQDNWFLPSDVEIIEEMDEETLA